VKRSPTDSPRYASSQPEHGWGGKDKPHEGKYVQMCYLSPTTTIILESRREEEAEKSIVRRIENKGDRQCDRQMIFTVVLDILGCRSPTCIGSFCYFTIYNS